MQLSQTRVRCLIPRLLRSQAKLMSECTESIDDLKRVEHILSRDEMLDCEGLTVLSSADRQTGVCVSQAVSVEMLLLVHKNNTCSFY